MNLQANIKWSNRPRSKGKIKFMSDELKPVAPATDEDKIEETVEEKPKEEEVIEEKSPYQEELDRIELEKKLLEDRHKEELATQRAERDRIMALKDKALNDEKEKTKSVKESWKSELKEELRQERTLERAQDEINKSTDDLSARKVILHHYQNSIVRSGNLADDIQMAIAIANRKRVAELLNERAAEDMDNKKSIASMGGGNLPGRSLFDLPPSAVARAASRLTAAYAGKDKEKAKKLTERVSTRFR